MTKRRTATHAAAPPDATPSVLADLTPDPTNRRRHPERNLAMIRESLTAVGPARSIVVDEHNMILAGNGLTAAAAAVGISKVRIVDAAADEVIAVRRSGLTDDQKRQLAKYDNRTAELAEWSAEQLAADLRDGFTLEPWFDAADLARLIPGGRAGRTDPDALPPERPTDIQPGDLFEIGRHRLLCGDATIGADVARLLGNEKPFLMVTDPPYGVEYDPDWRNRSLRADGSAIGGRRTGQVTNDDRIDWTPAWELFPGSVAYVWHASMFGGEVAASLALAGLNLRSQIIWNKPRFVISRGHYHWKHEACWYAFRDGASAKFTEDRSQTTVWDIDLKDATGETNHGTQKPVECMARPIRNHGGPEDHVYEPFSGSGSTLIAAEQFGRRCFAMEIEPTYVQMALDRWEAFTGQQATKIGAGSP